MRPSKQKTAGNAADMSRPTKLPLNEIRSPLSSWVSFVGVCVAAVAIAIPSLDGPFVFDDQNNVVQNELIQVWPPRLDWLHPETRPMVQATFALNYQMNGLDSTGYRLTNLGLHLVLAWMLLTLGRRLTRDSASSVDSMNPRVWVACVLIWMVHPLPWSTVFYVVQRSEIMASIAMVGFLDAIVRDHNASHRRWQFAACLWFAIGLTCKTNAAAVLPVAFLLDRYHLTRSWRETFRRRGWLYLGPLIAACLALAIMWPAMRHGGGGVGFSTELAAPATYFLNQTRIFWHYIELCVWPAHLCIDYGWPTEAVGPSLIPWVILTSLFICLGWIMLRRGFWLGWCMLSIPLLLAPTSTWIPIRDLVAEQRMYLASFFVFLSLVFGFIQLAERFHLHAPWVSGTTVRMVFGILLVGLASRTAIRAMDWRSAFDLWQSTAEVAPSHPRALQNWSQAAEAESRQEELMEQLGQLYLKQKRRGGATGVLASRLAEEQIRWGKDEGTERLLLDALGELKPSGSIDERQEFAAASVNLATLRLQQGVLQEAAHYLRQAVTADPTLPFAWAMLGELAMRNGQREEAVDCFERALELRPDWPEVIADLKRLKERE